MATRWVRSGAPMRRGAAPYADGCSHSIGAFTLHFPASFCSTRAELAADMARFCVRHNGAKSTLVSSTLVHPLHLDPSFLESSGPYMPVAPPGCCPHVCPEILSRRVPAGDREISSCSEVRDHDC